MNKIIAYYEVALYIKYIEKRYYVVNKDLVLLK
jgi:hypothetical protein